MNKGTITRNLQNCSEYDNEDLVVLDYLNQLKHQTVNLLEVGSGLCRFTKKISKLYKNININCIEINKDLAKVAQDEGFNVYNKNFLTNDFGAERYDVVHCAHVIEHFAYPEIIQVIDRLLNLTKTGGYLIIRSPLHWENFYYDIDHVRPYPPESILTYLYNRQQQVVGRNEVEVLNIWYRTTPRTLQHINKENYLYPIKPYRNIANKLIRRWNHIMKKLWNKYRWPASKPNGYVMILKKIK